MYNVHTVLQTGVELGRANTYLQLVGYMKQLLGGLSSISTVPPYLDPGVCAAHISTISGRANNTVPLS